MLFPQMLRHRFSRRLEGILASAADDGRFRAIPIQAQARKLTVQALRVQAFSVRSRLVTGNAGRHI